MHQKPDYNAVLSSLGRLGWTFLWPIRASRGSYLMQAPTGEKRKLKICTSYVPSGEGGRHRYGIPYTVLNSFDDFAFWADDEACVLIVPGSVLAIVYGKIDCPALNGGQWVVNIYFDRYGQQEIVPVRGETHSLSRYAYRIPKAAE